MSRRNLERRFNEWNDEVERSLSKSPERLERFLTASGIEVKRLYTPLDFNEEEYLVKLGFPGEYPFTRGVYKTMYRGQLWTMRQYAGFGTAEESNKRFKFLLSQGQTGLSVAFDLPTQMGYDSDHPLATGEVGRVGVVIDSLRDMEVLFDGIPLDKVSTSMTINAPTTVILAMYIVLAEKRGIPLSELRGTVQNDILKEYIARGMYIFPPRPSIKLVVDVIEFCTHNMPLWNPISISGYHIREAGADAVQEVAFTLANGVEYVRAVMERGLDVDRFAGRLSFFFSAHNNFFEEVAKFRAARRLWARIMKEKFGAKNERAMMLRFHVQTAGSTLTAQQPLNNIVRVAIQALAAVLGGAQSLHTNSFDEALALPSEEAVKVALRTQQIIAYETGVADTIDPLGGSYYVEFLTDRIEEEAERYIEEIENMGGMIAAIEKGYVQREIAKKAYSFQRAVEKGETVIVGVNMFREEEKVKVPVQRVDPSVEEKALKSLEKLRKERDNKKVREALEELKRKAEEGRENLMPAIINAVKVYATIGEVCNVLREVYGEYEHRTDF